MRTFVAVFIWGLAGGLVAAVIWAYFVFQTMTMLGSFSIGIGVAVGAAARIVCSRRNVTFKETRPAAALAAFAAVVCILVGHYLATVMIMSKFETPDEWDEPRWMSYVADEIVAEYNAHGELLDWPEGATPGRGVGPSDYPANVWDDTVVQWSEMTEEERGALKSRETEGYNQRAAAGRRSAFLQSVTGINALFLLFGAVAAYIFVETHRGPRI